jgi:predicted ribosomally synthesized peptide with SipW-like signal peptide
MRKKLLITVTIFTLVMALAGGATFALFNDSASNESKTISAGTVDIEVNRNAGDSVPGPMFYTIAEEGIVEPDQNVYHATGLWAPGDSHQAELDIKNNGSLEAKLVRVEAEFTGDTDFLNNQAAMEEFAKYMNVEIIAHNNEDISVYNGPLADLMVAGGDYLDLVPGYTIIGKNSIAHFRFCLTLSKDAGNVLQGQKPIVSFTVHAEQAK